MVLPDVVFIFLCIRVYVIETNRPDLPYLCLFLFHFISLWLISSIKNSSFTISKTATSHFHAAAAAAGILEVSLTFPYTKKNRGYSLIKRYTDLGQGTFSWILNEKQEATSLHKNKTTLDLRGSHDLNN